MPSNLALLDQMPDESGDLKEDYRALKNYVFMLSEQLRYALGNLEAGNFNQAALLALKEYFSGDVALALSGLTLNITEGENGMNYYFTSNGLQVGDTLTELRYYSTTGTLPPVGIVGGVVVNANGQPVLSNGWYAAWQSAWTGSTTTNVYRCSSYNGGVSWGIVTLVQGKNGANGSDATVTFNSVTRALANLFVKTSSGTPTQISDYYMYSPEIQAGTFYGCDFYAGVGEGYAHMDADGLEVLNASGQQKIMLGIEAGSSYDTPYLLLGAGSSANYRGLVEKFGNGLWIGNSSAMGSSTEPAVTSPNTGIWINFVTGKAYLIAGGVSTELATTASTVTAVFG